MKCRLFCLVLLISTLNFGFSQSFSDGTRLYNNEKYISASAAFNHIVTIEPENLSGRFWLMRSYSHAHQVQQMTSAFRAIPASQINQPLYQVCLGMIRLEQGDSLGAKNAFVAALGEGRKKDPAIQLAIAQVNVEANNGDIGYALELLAEAEKKDRKNPELFITRGDAYRKLYNGSEAFRNYQAAAELDAGNPVPYYKIGKIYQTQNNVDIFNEYYTKAINADAAFAPVYFQLYYYYYFRDVKTALGYLEKYAGLADPDIKTRYLLADLYYINKRFNESIREAKTIESTQADSLRPRIYKLLAYSYDGIKDSVSAEVSLKKYFEVASDTSYSADDLELMAKLLQQQKNDSGAMAWHERAFRLEQDTAKKALIVRKLIDFTKAKKLYALQADWYKELYGLHATMNNVDIFNWGVSNYNAQQYVMADSVFGIYQERYPEQTFGYYWRARSNAAMDTAMEEGLAVPHYEALIEVASRDTANANNRKWLIQAYGYIAAYKVNQEKKYNDALGYYDKILELDPDNNDAEKYKEILSRIIDQKTLADKDKQPPGGN